MCVCLSRLSEDLINHQEGMTPLHNSCEKGYGECVAELLRAGAEIGARDNVRAPYLIDER
jgi:ankyrin repeat protein